MEKFPIYIGNEKITRSSRLRSEADRLA